MYGADGAVEVPRWLRPGDEAATLYLTANCSFWLAILRGTCGSGAGEQHG